MVFGITGVSREASARRKGRARLPSGFQGGCRTVQGAHQDELHVPGNENLWFTETAWYSFWDPAGRYMDHVYMRFRPNTGAADCNVYIWTSGVSLPWDTAYWKCFAMAYPESIRDLKFVGGLTHRIEADFAKYRITYEDTTSPL